MGNRYVSAAYRELGGMLRQVRVQALQSLIFHESSASHVIGYEPQVVAGLLQSPNYARALVTAVDTDLDEDWVEGVVRTRMERRRILSVPNPARFTFYVHENALRLQVGTNANMQEQLLHLLLMTALDHVTMRVVPSAAHERSAFGSGFQLMEFQEHRPIVSMDHLRVGGLILEDPDYVRSYQKLLPTLAEVALCEGQSRCFAAALADAYDRGSQRRVADLLAKKQLQRRIGNELRGGGMVEPPTPIYE